jgi:hypothetical protein
LEVERMVVLSLSQPGSAKRRGRWWVGEEMEGEEATELSRLRVVLLRLLVVVVVVVVVV